jgi:hypothetical protein
MAVRGWAWLLAVDQTQTRLGLTPFGQKPKHRRVVRATLVVASLGLVLGPGYQAAGFQTRPKYWLFCLRAPKLAVFEWRCCYADEVRIEAVGRLSDVAIEVAAGRTRTLTPIGTEPKYVTIQHRDKLVTDILQGLMPGLQPHTWKDVTRYVYT